MKRNDVLFAISAIVVAVAFMVAITLIGGQVEVEAGPLAAPTPLVTGYNTQSPYYPVTFWDTQVITEDTGSTVFVLPKYEALDIQYNIDQTDGNTITLKLQHSNDATNWTDGLTLVSANGADASVLQQYTNFGIYTRIYADVTDNDPVTVTAIGVAK